MWNMDSMFQGATSFNQPLNNWNVSKGDVYGKYVLFRKILQPGSKIEREFLGSAESTNWKGELKAREVVSGLGWDEECRGWSGTWGGRIQEDPRGSERLGEREGGVKVELKPRTGRTEGLGGIRGFLAFPGRIRTRGGPFRVLSGT